MSDLSGADGAFRDPRTGDFFFSTFGGGDRVIVIRGFAAPVPTLSQPALLVLGGLLLLGVMALRSGVTGRA